MPGDVPTELGAFSSAQLHGAARLLRALHDVTMDFPDRGASEVVCHGDASPCNCVFQEGRPMAFIDFDAAHAGGRWDDLGYASWLWLDLGNEELEPVEQGRRLGGFVAAYGQLDATRALPVVLGAQRRLCERSEAPAATRAWAADCLDWTTVHRTRLEAGLAFVRQAAF